MQGKKGLKNFFFGRISRKIFASFLIFVIVFSAAEFFNIYQFQKAAEPLTSELPKSILEIQEQSNLDSLAQFIRYYDEVLTQSARNYAFTSDTKWKDRYYSFVPLLDNTIKQAIEKGDSVEKEFFSSVDAANIALIEMEEKAIALVDEGKPEEAVKILESRGYSEQKAIYQEGVKNYISKRGRNYDEALTASTTTLESASALANSSIQASLSAASVFFVVLISLGIIFGFFISRNISKPVHALHRATEELEKGNFAARVDIKTGDELQQLGEAFNKTIEELQRVDDEKKQIDKAKTQFLTITSHELRSPMTPMKAQLQMLEEGYFGKLSKKQKESVEIVINNADRLDKILVDFLEISRIEAARLKFEFKETDLEKLVKETVEYLKGFMPEKKIKIIAQTEKLPVIQADSDRIAQVLRNLINNAIKFSPPNSTITVSASPIKDFVLFSVKDSGVGISEEGQKKLFEPFYQVDKTFSRQQGGTGLGLAICRGIVESQNGKIWLESEEGKGTTFFFTVPLEPVLDVKPIKILFSGKEATEKKIEEIFKEILGPLGSKEFEYLKTTSGITDKSLLDYIALIEEKGIIQKQGALKFREMIKTAFGSGEESIKK